MDLTVENKNEFNRIAIENEQIITTNDQTIDTVQGLHETITSLRQALEKARKEVGDLRKHISIKTDIDLGKIYRTNQYIPFEESIKLNDENVITHSTRKPSKSSKKFKRTFHLEPTISVSKSPSDTQFFDHQINLPNKNMTSKIDVKIKVLQNVQVQPESSTTSDVNESTGSTNGDEDNAQTDTNVEPDVPEPELEDKNELTIRTMHSAMSTESANQEEVDDIELIFSSDDRELPQEDLVSISECDSFPKTGDAGTPILINYMPISSEQGGNGTTEMDHETDRKNAQYNATNQTSLDLSSSLSNVYNPNYKSSSFERDSSGEKTSDDQRTEGNIRKDQSLDTFDNVGNVLGRRWTKFNLPVETDISKCGIAEENILEMGRRNTCPNPTPYRPLVHREAMAQLRYAGRCPLSNKMPRNTNVRSGHCCYGQASGVRPIIVNSASSKCKRGPKRSASAQTEISALPESWRSETHLVSSRFGCGQFTLPSKFTSPGFAGNYKHNRYPLRFADKTQEARRVLLSDINFTSMVPELSRSADHLCQDGEQRDAENIDPLKSNQLSPDQTGYSRQCQNTVITSPGVSQWTVNENSYETQTTQTDNYWGHHGDSFDSYKTYSMGSRQSIGLDRHHRSQSVPSVRCAVCKQNHSGATSLKTSESMNYTPRVTFGLKQSQCGNVRGSLPDLRTECSCTRRYMHSNYHHRDSCGSTESLLDEADDVIKHSSESHNDVFGTTEVSRRYSENEIKRDYSPPKNSLPFLPKSPKCLKTGYLAKVISTNGRVVIGRIRYIGPLASDDNKDVFVGLQLPSKVGDCDGTVDGRRFFDCDPLHAIFVPFKKIVMAWTA